MTIKSIEYFLKVAELLNFREASAQLHIAHQSLSQQIRSLEAEIDAPLFERTTSRVKLTEVGEEMVRLFRPAYYQFHSAEDRIHEFVETKRRVLKVSYYSGLSYLHVVEPILQYIAQIAPDLRVEIQSDDLHVVRKNLMEDYTDLAITAMLNVENWKEVKYATILEEELRILVSNKHPWYDKEEVSGEDLIKYPLLVLKNGEMDPQQVFNHSIKSRRTIVTNFNTYVDILQQGECFGITSGLYNKFEGNFRFIDLPKSLACPASIICAYKPLHPNRKILNKLQAFDLKNK